MAQLLGISDNEHSFCPLKDRECAGDIALAGFVVQRRGKSPWLAHLLWLMVLIKCKHIICGQQVLYDALSPHSRECEIIIATLLQ